MRVCIACAGSGLRGTALAYFKVNESPSHGDCTIKPEVGVEMETDFRIFCKAWKDPVSNIKESE